MGKGTLLNPASESFAPTACSNKGVSPAVCCAVILSWKRTSPQICDSEHWTHSCLEQGHYDIQMAASDLPTYSFTSPSAEQLSPQSPEAALLSPAISYSRLLKELFLQHIMSFPAADAATNPGLSAVSDQYNHHKPLKDT